MPARFARALFIVMFARMLAPHDAGAVTPHASFSQLPTGNGFGFAVYDASQGKLAFFADHPYVQATPTESTEQFAYDAYFGVRAAGGASWLAALPVEHAEYEDQSHVVHASQSFGPLGAETYLYAPWGMSAPAVVLLLHVTNVSQESVTDGAAFALLNFHLGAGSPPDANGEHIVWDPTNACFTETGPSGATLAYVPLGALAVHGASPNNPFSILNEGGDLIQVDDSGVTDDAVAGFEWQFPPLAAAGDAWVGVVVSTASPAMLHAMFASADPAMLLTNELAEWEAWRTAPPAGLSASESRAWRQSESVLRMAQSREAAPSGGQIIAALPPGVWQITWVRDMSYATVALARSGHGAEANAAIDFLSGAQSGTFETFVEHPYHVSVVRYYGDGEEWSDSNADGPNIEFDGFGLSLWAAHSAGRTDLDADADTLRELIDDTGLVSPDSSIWEVHWDGQQRHFAYTTIAAANALCITGDATHALALRDALVQSVILPQGGLAGNLEAARTHIGGLDAAAIEAIDFGLIDPTGLLASDTLAAFEGLHTQVDRGYFRNDDGGGYDSEEWVFVDLRISDALRRMGRSADADELLAWVTAQADLNFDLQAELYDPTTADYAGSTPMVGFGAAAYMLALLDRANAAPPPSCFPPEHYTPPAQSTSTPDAGPLGGPPPVSHGCNATPGPSDRGSVVAFVLLGALLVRRRSAVLAMIAVSACTGGNHGGDAAPSDASFRGDAPPSVQGLPARDCTSRFVYALGATGETVSVAGEWSGFSPSANPMEDSLATGTYRAAISLPPGSYGYKFVNDGNWSLDPANGSSYYVMGIENSRLDVADCTLPLLQVVSRSVASDRTISIVVQYVDGTNRAGLNPASVAIQMNRAPLDASAFTIDATSAQFSIHFQAPANDKYTFDLTAADAAGRTSADLLVPMWVEDTPYQWGDGPLYFAFTDRFVDGDTTNDGMIPMVDARANYQGGDLAGVLQQLQAGYFDALGVRAIWLSPMNSNTHSAGGGGYGHLYSGYHGYWVNAARAIEPHWGSMDDLRAVTAEAHRRGIRVLLDVVNHQVHTEHPYYQMHATDWFVGDGSCVCGGPNCDWNVFATACWFAPYLPTVDWTNMTATDQMIADSIWWLSESDADGFRCDAVKNMLYSATTSLRAAIHQTFENGNAIYYTVGETFDGEGDRGQVASYVGPNALYGQFDYPLFWTIRSVFAYDEGAMADLDAAVLASEAAYGTGIMSPFLGNHDVERFITDASGQFTGGDQAWTDPPPAPDTDDPYNRLFLAFVFTLTQRGLPLIYYGDEIGMPGSSDPDNRRMMRFGTALTTREQTLFSRVTIAAHARGTYAGLQRGARQTLYTDGDGYVYARGGVGDLVIIALNRGSTSRSVMVPVPPSLGAEGTAFHDLYGGAPVTITGGMINVLFTPQGAAIFVQ